MAQARFCSTSSAAFGPALSFVYQVVTYTDGSKAVDCVVLDNNHSYSASSYLGLASGSLASSACTVVYDVEADATGGSFTFQNDVAGSVSERATYLDAFSPVSGTVLTFPSCL